MSGLFRAKIVRPEIKVLDESQGRIHAVVSTEAEDRDGDVIRANGWRLSNFLNHPVLLSSHDYRSLRSQIGEWEEMRVVGQRLEGIARYYVGEGNEEADWGFKLAARGKAAYSVGFIPDMDKAIARNGKGQRGLEFTGQELLEVSHVTIPANAEALQSLRTLSLHPAVAELVADLLEGSEPVGQIGNLPLLGTSATNASNTITVSSTTPFLTYLSDEQLERLADAIAAKLPPRIQTANEPRPDMAAALTESIRLAWRT